MPDTLVVTEIFHSLQGESTWAGCPCTFIRLTGCHLRCRYCDTEYAFHGGRRMGVAEIVRQAQQVGGGCPLVEVTGGEPLLQPAVHALMAALCDAGHTVLVETSGACDIALCDERVIRIMDLKTPASGECDRNLWSNIAHLTPRDEVKFVLCGRTDYQWAADVIREHDLPRRVRAVLLGAVHQMPPGRELPGATGLSLHELAQWMLADHWPVNVRLQVQLHKLIWDPATRGV